MQQTATGRETLMDNLKLILTFLVILGHVIEYFGRAGILNALYAVIYAFHMPLFVFVSGYFSKDTERAYRGAFKSCLLPYLLFNSLYSILTYGKLLINVFLPAHIFWYFLSLFFWRISAGLTSKLRFAVPISIAVSLYAGCFETVGMFLSVSRTLAFFPFFIMGTRCSEASLDSLRRVPKAVALCLLAALAYFVVRVSGMTIYSHNIFYMSEHYGALGFDRATGAAVRLGVILTAVCISACVLVLCPSKRGVLGSLGRGTVTAYVLQPFALKYAFRYLEAGGYLVMVRSHGEFAVLGGCVVLSLALTLLGTLPPLHRLYTLVFDLLNELFTR